MSNDKSQINDKFPIPDFSPFGIGHLDLICHLPLGSLWPKAPRGEEELSTVSPYLFSLFLEGTPISQLIQRVLRKDNIFHSILTPNKRTIKVYHSPYTTAKDNKNNQNIIRVIIRVTSCVPGPAPDPRGMEA